MEEKKVGESSFTLAHQINPIASTYSGNQGTKAQESRSIGREKDKTLPPLPSYLT